MTTILTMLMVSAGWCAEYYICPDKTAIISDSAWSNCMDWTAVEKTVFKAGDSGYLKDGNALTASFTIPESGKLGPLVTLGKYSTQGKDKYYYMTIGSGWNISGLFIGRDRTPAISKPVKPEPSEPIKPDPGEIGAEVVK